MLNKSQQAAAYSKCNKVLVLAGAGSGKTTTFAHRVAYYINSLKVSGHNILCLTFTRKAAQEMRERISGLIDTSETWKITIGTFHSVSLDIIKKFGHLIGYKRESLTVYDEDDQKEIFNYILNTGSYKIKKKDLNRVMFLYSTEEVLPGDDTTDDLRNIFYEYRSILKENNALDYSMILCECNRLIREFPQVKSWTKNKFKYVLVDEYQDTNLTQYNLHNLIEPEYLFCVGDDYQAIYGWRGSKIDIILNFEKDHPESKIYYLTENYRSGKEIVEAGNYLIRHNKNQFHKELVAQKDIKSKVKVNKYNNLDEFSYTLVVYLDRYMSNPFVNYSDICVLSRKHAYLQRIAQHLEEKNISYLYVGSSNKFFSRPEVKLINAYLHLFYNPADNLNFMRIMSAENISRKEYIQIRRQALEEDKGHFEVYINSIWEGIIKTIVSDINAGKLTFHSILNELLTYITSDLKDTLAAKYEEILNKFFDIILKNNLETLEDYIKWYALRDIQDELAAEQKDCVKLMTVHAAKGLEFNRVIIAGCMEDCFPLKSGDLEEERRLMYVAITRGIETVDMTWWAEDVSYDGQSTISRKKSKFVEEIK